MSSSSRVAVVGAEGARGNGVRMLPDGNIRCSRHRDMSAGETIQHRHLPLVKHVVSLS